MYMYVYIYIYIYYVIYIYIYIYILHNIYKKYIYHVNKVFVHV